MSKGKNLQTKNVKKGSQSTSGGNTNLIKDWKSFMDQHGIFVYGFIGFLAVLLGGFIFVPMYLNRPKIHSLKLTNQYDVEKVFKSGDPWFVLCETKNKQVPTVFQDVAERVFTPSKYRSYKDSDISIGVMDCSETFPSGETIYERFKFSKAQPTVFTIANGGKPKQVSSKDMKDAKSLYYKVKDQVVKPFTKVKSIEYLSSRCLKFADCGLVLRGTNAFSLHDKIWLYKLINNYRKMKWTWMDSTEFDLIMKDSDKNFIPTYNKGQHRFIYFKKLKNENAMPGDEKNDTIRSSMKSYKKKGLNFQDLNAFIEKNQKKRLPNLDYLPEMKLRNPMVKEKTKGEEAREKLKKKREEEEMDPKIAEERRRKRMEAMEQEYFPQAANGEDQEDQEEEEEEEEEVDLEDN